MKPIRLRPDEPMLRIKPGFDCRRGGTRAPWDKPRYQQTKWLRYQLHEISGGLLGGAIGNVFGQPAQQQVNAQMAQQEALSAFQRGFK